MTLSSWIVNYSSGSCSSTATTFKRVFYFGFISHFCHQNWDSNSEEDKTESTVKTEQIIFPSHIIYLTEGSKRKGENRKNLGLPANLSFALRSSILSAPLNLVLPQTGQQRPSAIGNKWSGQGGATTHGRRCNTQLLGFTLYYRSGFETFGHRCFQEKTGFLGNCVYQQRQILPKSWPLNY